MMTVEFTKGYGTRYFKGDRAGFDEKTEAELVKSGVAKKVEPKPKASPQNKAATPGQTKGD